MMPEVYWSPSKLLDGPLGRAVAAKLGCLDAGALEEIAGLPRNGTPKSAPANWRSRQPRFFCGAGDSGRTLC
jgi:hypothetical protein